MRSFAALMAGLLVLASAAPLRADSYITSTGFYYKERSTRVVAPAVNAHVELPSGWSVDGGVLVDQVTSASAAFTPDDKAFTEYRIQGTLGVDYTLRSGVVGVLALDTLRVGVNARVSNESDYRSILGGGRLNALFNDKLSSAGASFQYQADALRQPGPSGIRRNLKAVFVSLTGSQVITPRFLVGGVFNAQILRGYLENVYRLEQHPTERNDYSLGYFLRYRYGPWGLGGIFEQCAHYSTWGHKALTTNLEIWQTITPWLEVVPRIRVHLQSSADFVDRLDVPDPNDPTGDPITLFTTDPTLFESETVTGGVRVIFAPPFLDGLQINPAYYVMYQSTRYGIAHIAQVVLYYPFSIE